MLTPRSITVSKAPPRITHRYVGGPDPALVRRCAAELRRLLAR
jgi:hypothetical protein